MSRPQRIPGFAYVGRHQYFLTICTKDRLTAFLDAEIAKQTLDRFLITATKEAFAILAYCLMPDHTHLLVEGSTDESDFRRFVRMSKQRSGAMFALANSRQLWQEGYFERVLRKEEDLRAIARYILENPVRAKLVSEPTAYPHLGSTVWTVAELLEGTRAD